MMVLDCFPLTLITPESIICPIDGYQADIANSKILDLGPALARDSQTESVVTCGDDHETVV
jgi:hypothetical protein